MMNGQYLIKQAEQQAYALGVLGQHYHQALLRLFIIK